MARRFRFRLEPVLRYRGRIEEERMRDFALAQGRVVEQERQLEEIASEKAEHQEEIARLSREGVAVDQILEFHRYINTLNVRAALGQRELAVRREELDRRRADLLEARKDHRALELLKERRWEDHRREEAREEADLVNELAIQRFRANHPVE
ncbi:MAG: flagellar export protein FliJ [Planctomycetota bacterium]